ncbi:PucR family transcriptional regulator [Nocardia sp. NPDC058058]|uniref:PucR family transcriptional regulator n=1 Tax=Nocardia sp. NPDC058058 TaxID=3346317 RepID=UPI0036D8219C
MTTRPAGSAEQRLLEQVRMRAGEISERIVARARAEISAYAALPASIFEATRLLIELTLVLLVEGRDLNDAERAIVRAFGETRAQQGVSLAELHNGWRMAVNEVLGEFAAAAAECDVSDRGLYDLSIRLLGLLDQATVAYSAGHGDVQLAAARHDGHLRADFTRALLLGTLGPADAAARARRFGLDTGREYRAFRTTGSDPTMVIAPWSMGREFGQHVFVATIDGSIAGFFDATRSLGTEMSIGIGPPVPLDELDRSFRLATRLLATARAHNLSGVADLDQLGLLPTIAADPDIGAEFVRRYLTPLGSGDSARALIETVTGFLDNGMRVDATAEQLVVHPNTVRYRIDRFEQLTGCELRSAHTALRVWWAVQYLRTIDGS